jgi:hypothetical protein
MVKWYGCITYATSLKKSKKQSLQHIPVRYGAKIITHYAFIKGKAKIFRILFHGYCLHVTAG